MPIKKLSYHEIFSTRPTIKELAQIEKFPYYCLIENIRSLYNVGSIFRTSDALRLKCLYLTGYTGKPPRREIDKTALGAVETVPWRYFNNPLDAITELKSQKINIIALEHTNKSIPYYKFTFNFPFCLMLGNEVEGLSGKLISQADSAIEIPMFGLKQSLNVTVAFGIVMYHVLSGFLKENT
jgi:tRNA G18 (ribose-2'-O)-methylase SpoU